MKKYDCAGIGLCTLDRIMLLPEYPGKNEKRTALRSKVCGGGPIANAIYALARLGHSTAICGKVGGDYEGRLIWEWNASAGVNTRCMVSDPAGKTPSAQIWVDKKTGSRTVVLDETGISPLTFNEIPTEILESSQYILLDGRDSALCLKIAQSARDSGAKIVYDLGSMRKNVEALLKSADIVIASADFAEAFNPGGDADIALKKIFDAGPEIAVITLGAKGWIWRDRKGHGRSDAFKVDVVDTTGAGDVFHGAFIHGLLRGRDTSGSAEFAGAAAGMTCTVLGGRDAFDSEKDVLDFMGRRH